MFSGPVSGFNPVTSQSYAVATALGAPVPTTKEATPTRPARIRGTPFEEPEGWRPKSGLPHVPEYVDQEVNVPAGVAKGWQEHYPYMLRGLGEFQNIIQGDEVSRNTLKIMTDKSLGFNEKNKLLQEQYDSLPESEKLIYDHANPGQWAVDILGGKALSKSGPLWKGLGKVTGINKLIRKWKMRGETIYSPESPGPEAVEERLESIHDIAILKSPKIKTEIPQVIQPGQERLAEFRKTIPEKVDVSPEAMNNWRAEVGDKYGISADTARVKMKEAGGIIAEEIPEQKIFNDWATEFTTIQRIHNKDFKEKAIGISDIGMAKAIDVIAPGVTEKDVALALEIEMRSFGADGIAFDAIVATGLNSSQPHHRASDTEIAVGDSVVVDIGAVYCGYRSDVSRTVYVGSEPSNQFKSRYNVVRIAQMEAISLLKTGMTGHEVDLIARNLINSSEFEGAFCHGLGHGVGLDIHEKPMIVPGSKDVLSENMIFTVEPGVYFPDWGGIRLEDVVILEKSGARVLTQASKHMEKLI